MIAKSTPRLLLNGQERPKHAGAPDVLSGPPSLIGVLWTRRKALLLPLAPCLLLAVVYLLVAKPTYSSSAIIYVEPNGPKPFSENQGFTATPENFLYKEAEVVRSAPIVARALLAVNYRQMKTFARVTEDPTNWITQGSAFNVQVEKKDVITVSMEAPDAQEAADFVNAVVDSYVAEQSRRKALMGDAMVANLKQEKEVLEKKRDAQLQVMVKFKEENGALSFKEDKGNIVLERLASLASSVTNAELAAVNLRSQVISARAMLSNPASISAYVEAQQSKAGDRGEKEYDDLRSQLQQRVLALTELSGVMGTGNSRLQQLQAGVNMLEQKIAEKERAIAEAHVAELSTELAATEDQIGNLKQTLKEQHDEAFRMNPKAVQYARLEADLDRVQKQADVLDTRIEEVTVNSRDAGPLSVEVVEPARAQTNPIKPRRSLILGAALLAAIMLGVSNALLREVSDTRLRSPHELGPLLGVPVIGTVPGIRQELTLVERGQIVVLDPMSEAAEAYRVIRTALRFGPARDAKTLLVASPAPGDGKSITASNLAIALALAGQRTVLIDCNLRQPVQQATFELAVGRPGLADAMAGQEKLQDVIYETGVDGLYLLPCGTLPANPSELLGGKGFRHVMQALAVMFDRVVIDSAPLAAVTDTRILAASADATLLVVRMNQSQRTLGALALDALHAVGANVVGVIANDMPANNEQLYSRYISADDKPRLQCNVDGDFDVSEPTTKPPTRYELPADTGSSNGVHAESKTATS